MSLEDRVLEIINSNKIAMFGTIGENGSPYIKAMLLTKNDGLNLFWFCSNTCSKRRNHIMQNPNACLYFYEGFDGVMLTGKAEISYDNDMRLQFWNDDMYYHYPQGPKDPDYMLIKFIAVNGNFYSQKKNEDFEI